MVAFGRTISFGALNDRQRSLAGALEEEGLCGRDRIAVLSANRPELLEVTTGALRAGIVPVPMHASLTPREIAYLIEDSGARWLFTDRSVDAHPQLERIVTFGDAYERLLHDASPTAIADFMLGRPMHYTSGTTGNPKGVWVNPLSEQRAAEMSHGFKELWSLSSDDIHLVCSPLSHSAPHRFAARTLEAGGTVVIQKRFYAEETLAAIELFGATTTFVVPTHLERVFSLDTHVLARHHAGSIRLLAHAGAPIREETKRRTIELFGVGAVWEFYGATEGQATRISSPEWLRKPGSVGTPPEGAEVIVVDDEWRRLPPGSVGQIWIRDPSQERFEYWADPAKTNAAWHGDAFTLGDLGSLDDDGYLYLAGRVHDTIVSGGVNVYPREVENVLLEHPAVREALVYGAPHPEWGEQVVARVVPSFRQPLDLEALGRWLRERLAPFKCPRHIEVVESLPRTPTGKPRRPRLEWS
jgi:acyl-CoA synthetase (AMP-forming)/AMP-acid ligase II